MLHGVLSHTVNLIMHSLCKMCSSSTVQFASLNFYSCIDSYHILTAAGGKYNEVLAVVFATSPCLLPMSVILLPLSIGMLFMDARCAARAVSVLLYLAPGTAGKIGRGWKDELDDLGLIVLKRFEDTSSSDFSTCKIKENN